MESAHHHFTTTHTAQQEHRSLSINLMCYMTFAIVLIMILFCYTWMLLLLEVTVLNFCAQQLFRSKPAWNRANETQIMEYSNNLRYRLSNVSLPLSALLCHDVNMDDINKYVEEISASCLSAASHTIPLTTNRQSGRVPGWSEYVEPFKKKISFLASFVGAVWSA